MMQKILWEVLTLSTLFMLMVSQASLGQDRTK